jgi:hypothetical protein
MADVTNQAHPSIRQIETELKKRVANHPPTQWGRKQNNAWDRQTRFIYDVPEWAALRRQITAFEQPLANYAVNRWFNYWSAYAVEQIFCTMPGVTANVNQKDRLVDFAINGINFDHKTSVFPQKYTQSTRFAWFNKAHLITWLYQNQSRQQRYHTANRLFIILYARNEQHWALRAELGLLHDKIKKYIDAFTPDNLVEIRLGQDTALSDLIWCVN